MLVLAMAQLRRARRERVEKLQRRAQAAFFIINHRVQRRVFPLREAGNERVYVYGKARRGKGAAKVAYKPVVTSARRYTAAASGRVGAEMSPV